MTYNDKETTALPTLIFLQGTRGSFEFIASTPHANNVPSNISNRHRAKHTSTTTITKWRRRGSHSCQSSALAQHIQIVNKREQEPPRTKLKVHLPFCFLVVLPFVRWPSLPIRCIQVFFRRSALAYVDDPSTTEPKQETRIKTFGQ